MDEGGARVDDIALLNEGSKASATQADGVDAQMNQDRSPRVEVIIAACDLSLVTTPLMGE